MTRSQARHEINEILDHVRWAETRKGSPCKKSRDTALRGIISLCNKVGATMSSGYALNALNANRKA